ncbi:uncharacterized protein LTR77_000816 [Saxophila tyrrhenica]|uniref:Phosphatidate phosphatase APP1 catalytic domain-containing protein n=1 Tax=Saxophila tyrrhenica TaxID=1690608 RepID=A0AAV9PS82_9PEZI|nr:hypothetical protein LTR77_000816 [Saxophila tyrrhenica]
MAYQGSAAGTYDELAGLRAEGREPGWRRKKIGGYLKAANELRQSYFSQENGGAGTRDGTYESGVEGPGAFPDAAVVRSGNEEMVLFPSYGRRHVKRKTAPPPAATGEVNEQDYWRREWERHQDDNAIVDVDVRGWIYTPHRGATTRKQRLMIGLARQMVGIQAPPAGSSSEGTYASSTSSRAPSPQRSKQEEEFIAREAENIVRKGEQEERYARRGAFSEVPQAGGDGDSLYEYSSQGNSRASSPERGRNRMSQVSLASSTDGDSGTMTPPQRRTTGSQAAKMSNAELHMANHHLLTRLKPFMANPLANSPISAFFYNESVSRQHTVYTDASGHFSCRAALDFIPTHVRILAGEKLSATEEVNITSPRGVSMISDIDDTIKHSAILAGAREIFRNAFIRELGDLTIDGVREWYNTMHDMGVSLHYVSNSPWQMYPILTSYFKMANLPRGSFHLKQYSGMLQGIFEPVAERKKASLDKIMRDFPDRKFILVGDSGEADLEVYTDTALDNPGRVLGIFIRDVTTSSKGGYFDPSNGTSGGGIRNHSRGKSTDSLSSSKQLARPNDIRNDDEDLRTAIAASLADMEEETRRARRSINPDSPSPEYAETPKAKPDPPPRRGTARSFTQFPEVTSPEEDLIDFSEEPAAKKPWLEPPPPRRSSSATTVKANGTSGQKSMPSPPPKPEALRSTSPGPHQSSASPEPSSKTPPPRPRKPSSAVKAPSPKQVEQWTARPPMPTITTNMPQVKPSPLSQVTQQSPETPKQRPPLPTRRNESALAKGLATTHKALAPTLYWQSETAIGQPRPGTSHAETPRPLSTASTRSMSELRPSTTRAPAPPPIPPPPRQRNAPTYSTTTTRKTTNRNSGGWDDGSGGGGGGGSLPGSPGEAGMSKKEFLWSQRWARAKQMLERQGVVLRSWRVGSDVADVCVRLAEQGIREAEREGKSGKGGAGG